MLGWSAVSPYFLFKVYKVMCFFEGGKGPTHRCVLLLTQLLLSYLTVLTVDCYQLTIPRGRSVDRDSCVLGSSGKPRSKVGLDCPFNAFCCGPACPWVH